MSSYSVAVLADSPAGYWRLNEASGNALDSGSGNKPLTVDAAGTTRQVAGALVTDTDTAVDLDGVAGTLSTATSVDVGDVFTLEAWVRRDQSRVEYVFGKTATSTPVLRFASAANDLFTLRSTGVADVVSSTVGLPPDGFWHHMVATKSGATVVLYLDGRVVTGTVTNQTMAANTGTFRIANIGSTFFDGRVDEVAIYTTALSAARVLAHYRAGSRVRLALAGVG